MRYLAHGECLSRRPCKDCDLRFSLQYVKDHFPHFIPPLEGEVRRGLFLFLSLPLEGEVRRGLVSRWAVKPACLVYIPIGEREFT